MISKSTNLFKWGAALVLFFCSFYIQAQSEPYEITWDFSGTKQGFSSSTNFLAQDAAFGTEVYDRGYVPVDGTNQAIIAQNWPAERDDNFYLQFELTPLQYNYDLISVFTRLKRSANGPREFTVNMTITKFNSFEDSVSFDVGTFSLPTEEFTTVRINPVNSLNQHSTYKIRIYAYGALSVYEDLAVDYIRVEGDRTNNVLPVKLTYFKVATAGNRIDLSWETAWERNSKEFIIQRSSDLREFEDIGRLDAAGETDGRRQYIFSDTAPLIGANYYRLRSVDRDDTYEYSLTKDAIYRPDQPVILVGPNPVTDNIIRLRAFRIDNSSLRLTSPLGQSIPVRLNHKNSEEWELRPSTPLAPGVYFITANTESINPLTVRVLVK